jgi:excisionase family DNA binding protein
MPTEPLAYRPTEAAVLLGLSKARVYELINSGDLPARRVGRRILVPRDELVAWLANQPEVEAV